MATTKTSPGLKVKKSDLVALYVALGLKNAGGWDDTKLVAKLADLESLDDGSAKLNTDQRKLFKQLVKAVDNDQNVVVEGGLAPLGRGKATPPVAAKKGGKAAAQDDDDEDSDDDEEDEDEEESNDEDDEAEAEDDDSEEDEEESDEDEDDDSEEDEEEDEDEEPVSKKASAKGKPEVKSKPPVKAAAKGGKDEKPAKKASKPRGEPAEVDRFGMREGTRAARINAAIDGKPRSLKEIMERAKYDKPIHGHMQKLRALGHVKVQDGLWFDPKLAKAKAAGKDAPPAKKKK